MCKIVFFTFQASRVNMHGRSSDLRRILFIFPQRAKRRFFLTLTVTWRSWGNELCAIAQGSLETFTEQSYVAWQFKHKISLITCQFNQRHDSNPSSITAIWIIRKLRTRMPRRYAMLRVFLFPLQYLTWFASMEYTSWTILSCYVEGSASYTEAVRLLSLFSLLAGLHSMERILSTNLVFCAHSLWLSFPLSSLSFIHVPSLSASLLNQAQPGPRP